MTQIANSQVLFFFNSEDFFLIIQEKCIVFFLTSAVFIRKLRYTNFTIYVQAYVLAIYSYTKDLPRTIRTTPPSIHAASEETPPA